MSWQTNGLRQAIELIPVGVAVTQPDGRIEYANPHLRHLLGLGEATLRRVYLSKLRGKEGAALGGKIVRHLLARGVWQAETEFVARKGGRRHVLEAVYPLRDERGKVTHFIHILQDISASKRAEMLSSLAFYDSLTGLPNRNLFNDRLAQAVAGAKRNGSGFAVLYVDIDRFKQVNDRLGHDGGDELLRQVATRLRQGLRQSDTVARLGGDEFVAILENVSGKGMVAKVARKLVAACCGGYRLRGQCLQVALSIGVSFYPEDARDMEALLRCADSAMYRAKAAGGQCYALQEASVRYVAALA